MANTERQTTRIKKALHLIKIHISAEQTGGIGQRNRDLHEAIQELVTFARIEGYLNEHTHHGVMTNKNHAT
jgi:hypothetical protein